MKSANKGIKIPTIRHILNYNCIMKLEQNERYFEIIMASEAGGKKWSIKNFPKYF